MSEIGPDRNPKGNSGDKSGNNDGHVDGRGEAVEAALASLSAVGRREQRDLGPDTIVAIARAAAAERVGVPVTDPGHRRLSAVADIEPLAPADPSGLRPRPARSRSVLALAAALLVAAGLGGAILTAAPQQVETQDSAAAGSSQQGPDSPEPAEAERPVLDLGESIATTVVTTPIVADQAETTTPNVEASDDPASSTTTAPPPSSAPSTVAPPSTAPPVTQPTAEPPATVDPANEGRTLALELGVGGTIELNLDDSRPTLGRVALVEGWTGNSTTPRPGAFGYQLDDGYSVASLEVWSEPGWFRLDVDHGGRWPSSTEWTRTITIDRGGTVDVRHGTHGLSGLEILLGQGWQHRVDSVGPDHLLVVITSPDPTREREFRVDAGPATVDIRITGS